MLDEFHVLKKSEKKQKILTKLIMNDTNGITHIGVPILVQLNKKFYFFFRGAVGVGIHSHPL